MFFELALNGIGGRTIHEVKSNLTMLEVQQWAAYRTRRGSLNIGRRVEQAIGGLAAFYYNTKVKKEHWIDATDLMPHEDRPKHLTFEEERMQAIKKRESL